MTFTEEGQYQHFSDFFWGGMRTGIATSISVILSTLLMIPFWHKEIPIALIWITIGFMFIWWVIPIVLGQGSIWDKKLSDKK